MAVKKARAGTSARSRAPAKRRDEAQPSEVNRRATSESMGTSARP